MNEVKIPYRHPLVRDGRSRADRQNADLLPENVKIDGRGLDDILTFIYELSRQINFFDEQTRRQGDWQDFFRLSGPVLLAGIRKLNLKELEADYNRASGAYLNGIDRGNPKPLFDRQFEMALMINDWFKNLQTDPSGFQQRIRDLILTNLQFAVQRLIALGKSEPAADAGYRLFEHYERQLSSNAVWDLSYDREIEILPEIIPWGSRNRQRKELERRLNENFQVFFRALEQLQKSVADFLPASLGILEKKPAVNSVNSVVIPSNETESFQKHEPHLGLLYAFLKLYDQVRGNLNEHSRNHLEFFYKRVLKLREKAARPDQAHLVFEVSEPFTDHLVKKDVLFSAGDDQNGVEQQFRLDEELFVQKTRIESLRTLFLDKREVKKELNGEVKPVSTIQGAYHALKADSADGLGLDFAGVKPPSWPTLGAVNSRLNDPVTGSPAPYPDARLGLALASAVLYLKEGYRRIRLTINCTMPDYLKDKLARDFINFKQALDTLFYISPQTVAGLIEGGLDPASQIPNLQGAFGTGSKNSKGFRQFTSEKLTGDQQRVFEQHIERRLAFKAALTGEKGWIEPHEVDISFDLNEKGLGELIIQIALGPEYPSVLPFDPLVFGFDLGTKEPVCKLELDPDLKFALEIKGDNESSSLQEVSVYQAFREMVMTDINIEVSVDGVRDLIVQNSDGVLDIASPFQPFGGAPKTGSEVYIGSREVFHKKLKALNGLPGLRLNLSWDNLPASFFEHYRMYGLEKEIFSHLYEGSLHILHQGAWKPLDANEPFNQPNKKLFTGLNFEWIEDGDLKYCRITDKGVLVLEVHGVEKNDSDTGLDQSSTDSDFGNILFLALDEKKYEKVEEGDDKPSSFKIKSTNEKIFALTRVYPAKTEKGVVAAEIAGILTRTSVSLEVNDFADLRANPRVEQLALTNAGRNGFIALRLLGPDFFHKVYPEAFARQSTAQALSLQIQTILNTQVKVEDSVINISSIPTPPQVKKARFRSIHDPTEVIPGSDSVFEDPAKYSDYVAELPNEPFSPALNALSVDYQAEAGVYEMEAFHLYPFEEGNYLKLDLKAGTPVVLPKFEDPGVEGVEEKQGNLFIGLTDLIRGNNLSLLFQVAEATADPDLERAVLSWHYLSNNQWKHLDDHIQVLSDGTNGLLQSGIVQIAVPYDINRNNTILPGHLYWLKVSAPSRAAATSQTIAVKPHAGRATFAPAAGNDLERLDTPLDATSISAFINEDPRIKSLSQPFPSFGGWPPEKEGSFYVRVSERLRHKGRAITLFDYETILLEAFPKVFRLKCIPHTLPRIGKDQDWELAPGHITLAVIPDLRAEENANLLEPKFAVGALQEMEQYMVEFCSPFVRLHVQNPRYERVAIEAKVSFKPGKSAEYYRKELKKEVTGFLSPWASGQLDRISFGGEIFGSHILNFMEQREYVDFITDFVMKDEKGKQVDQVNTRSARSILVSGDHFIQAI